MRFPQYVLVIFLSLLSAYVATHWGNSATKPSAVAAKETAYERVMRTNVLRCGYAIATPWFWVDPISQEKKGYSYEVTKEVAEKMGVKIDWVEETGWGVAEQGLISGRYDMVCGSVCIDPKRNRAALFSTPFKHLPIVPVVRAGDTRFNEDISLINDPNIKVGVKNGHVFEAIAKEKFPKAKFVYANDLSDDTEFFLMLNAKKIDVAFSGKITVDDYNKKTDEKIDVVPTPVKHCDGAFMLPAGDFALKHMVDNALLEMATSGRFKDIALKYTPVNPVYLSVPQMP